MGKDKGFGFALNFVNVYGCKKIGVYGVQSSSDRKHGPRLTLDQ